MTCVSSNLQMHAALHSVYLSDTDLQLWFEYGMGITVCLSTALPCHAYIAKQYNIKHEGTGITCSCTAATQTSEFNSKPSYLMPCMSVTHML